MSDTYHISHDSVVLHHIAALQAATGSLAIRLRESAQDDSLSEHLPYLREILAQVTLFGYAYLKSAPGEDATDADPAE
ncbi:TPA: hypothetical protein JG914_000090 [Enterobacter hormaechei subsp. steigerwaltii]|nr:hypothetical protein [Enterobacter hormaechei subsp. steigerwaltii]